MEDVFNGEEAELPKESRLTLDPARKRWSYTTKPTFPIAVGAPTALEEKPEGGHTGREGGKLEEEYLLSQ